MGCDPVAWWPNMLAAERGGGYESCWISSFYGFFCFFFAPSFSYGNLMRNDERLSARITLAENPSLNLTIVIFTFKSLGFVEK